MASVEEIDQEWDAQIDSDSAAGKIDFLFEEADSEGKAGTLRDWLPSTQPKVQTPAAHFP
jgi:hypothetical protein